MNFSGRTKVDLDGLVSFRNKLGTRIGQVSNQENETIRAINVVSQSWEDGNFKDFEFQFSQDVQRIKALLEELNYFNNPVLRSFQEKLEAYLNIKY